MTVAAPSFQVSFSLASEKLVLKLLNALTNYGSTLELLFIRLLFPCTLEWFQPSFPGSAYTRDAHNFLLASHSWLALWHAILKTEAPGYKPFIW